MIWRTAASSILFNALSGTLVCAWTTISGLSPPPPQRVLSRFGPLRLSQQEDDFPSSFGSSPAEGAQLAAELFRVAERKGIRLEPSDYTLLDSEETENEVDDDDNDDWGDELFFVHEAGAVLAAEFAVHAYERGIFLTEYDVPREDEEEEERKNDDDQINNVKKPLFPGGFTIKAERKTRDSSPYLGMPVNDEALLAMFVGVFAARMYMSAANLVEKCQIFWQRVTTRPPRNPRRRRISVVRTTTSTSTTTTLAPKSTLFSAAPLVKLPLGGLAIGLVFLVLSLLAATATSALVTGAQ